MEKAVRDSIVKLLRDAVSAMKKDDAFRLKELSNDHIDRLPIFQDADHLSASVAVYALSKTIEHSKKKKEIAAKLESAAYALSSGRDDKYRAIMRALVKGIRSDDYKFKRYVFNIIENARVRKGFDLYEHGLSVGRVASMLAVSRWELLQYLGKTRATEPSQELIPTEQRLDFARRIFS